VRNDNILDINGQEVSVPSFMDENELKSVLMKRKQLIEIDAEKRAKMRCLAWQKEKKSLEVIIDETLKEYSDLYEKAHALRLQFEHEKQIWSAYFRDLMNDHTRKSIKSNSFDKKRFESKAQSTSWLHNGYMDQNMDTLPTDGEIVNNDEYGKPRGQSWNLENDHIRTSILKSVNRDKTTPKKTFVVPWSIKKDGNPQHADINGIKGHIHDASLRYSHNSGGKDAPEKEDDNEPHLRVQDFLE
jgi:hypothetical protein